MLIYKKREEELQRGQLQDKRTYVLFFKSKRDKIKILLKHNLSVCNGRHIPLKDQAISSMFLNIPKYIYNNFNKPGSIRVFFLY